MHFSLTKDKPLLYLTARTRFQQICIWAENRLARNEQHDLNPTLSAGGHQGHGAWVALQYSQLQFMEASGAFDPEKPQLARA